MICNNFISIRFQIIIFLITIFNSVSGQISGKIDQKLALVPHEQTVDIVILLKEQADISKAKFLKGKKAKARYVHQQLMQTAELSQRNVVEYLTSNSIPFQSFYLVNMIEAKVNNDQLIALAQREEIKYLMENGNLYQEEFIRAPEIAVGTQRMPLWNLDSIGVPLVWSKGIKGQNVVIGGQDTGYAWEIATIKSKYRGWNGVTANHNYNWHDAIHSENTMTSPGNPCGYDAASPCDDDNHGTHTMGTMVGDFDDGGREIGMAPHSKWIGCRNMEQGYGTLTSYTECFQWFLAPYALGQNSSQGVPDSMPHVINNSWSCPPIEGCNAANWEVIRLAIENLKNAGCVVVVSAGNSGSSCSTVSSPPAIFGESYSVGATGSNNQIANFSSRGHVTVDGSNRIKPDISAPGVGVRSCLKDSTFASYSGTSMAGPHVAGLVALMISANPALEGEVDKIQEIINFTAKHKTTTQSCNNVPGSAIPNNTFGYGIIDAAAAVDMVLSDNYLPCVTYHQSVYIDRSDSGLVLTNSLNKKVRIRVDNNGVILKDSDAIVQTGGIHIHQSSLHLQTASCNLILKSSDGNKWALKVSDSGMLYTELVANLPGTITILSGDVHISGPKHGILIKSPSDFEYAVNNTTLYHLLTIPMSSGN